MVYKLQGRLRLGVRKNFFTESMNWLFREVVEAWGVFKRHVNVVMKNMI